MKFFRPVVAFLTLAIASSCLAQKNPIPEDKFRQLEEILPTPTDYRTASGAPGHRYWQQTANYEIDVVLDDANQRIIGSEKISYTNRSPDTLKYIWIQLDQNLFSPDADAVATETAPGMEKLSYEKLRSLLARQEFDGGYKIKSVKDAKQKDLKHTIVKTMMRIELPTRLMSGETFVFTIDWEHNINDSDVIWGRTGYEYFKEDKNYIYELAQWYPRVASYTDVTGWQHKQFLGRGEFTLEFGDYVVRITAPDDHVVASTGTLMNPAEILSSDQRLRLEQAKTAKSPVFIVTPDEAKANEKTDPKSKPAGTKTWVFKADNVRDFAFASSRKFIWDAQGHDVNGNETMAMSYYPNEAEPLWSKYSTASIVHTLNVYSRYTFDYPYPVAISVNGPVYGMEYPMICFNGPRPEDDGTYSERTKYSLISVIIHEVGHNYFPMIVNSDERQWTWMDEGLNTFVQYLAEQEWEEKYPTWAGDVEKVKAYMKGNNQVPIMTNSESIQQFGNNAYVKPSIALNILRETILGREQFDYAFKEYAQRWKFKRPMPADFFRSMEDASGIDLDWFFRGWFYSTDHVDIAISNVKQFRLDSRNPDVENRIEKHERDSKPTSISDQRNKSIPKLINTIPDLKDFYNSYDELNVTAADKKSYKDLIEKLEGNEKELLSLKKYFYVVDFENLGGLVMPVIVRLEFEGGKAEELRIPAEIWRRNHKRVSKLLILDRPLKSLVLDPHSETADVGEENNYFPRRIQKSRFQLFKDNKEKNPMQKAAAATKKAEAEKKTKPAAKPASKKAK